MAAKKESRPHKSSEASTMLPSQLSFTSYSYSHNWRSLVNYSGEQLLETAITLAGGKRLLKSVYLHHCVETISVYQVWNSRERLLVFLNGKFTCFINNIHFSSLTCYNCTSKVPVALIRGNFKSPCALFDCGSPRHGLLMNLWLTFWYMKIPNLQEEGIEPKKFKPMGWNFRKYSSARFNKNTKYRLHLILKKFEYLKRLLRYSVWIHSIPKRGICSM